MNTSNVQLNKTVRTEDGIAILRPRIENISIQTQSDGTAALIASDGRATISLILEPADRCWLASLLLAELSPVTQLSTASPTATLADTPSRAWSCCCSPSDSPAALRR